MSEQATINNPSNVQNPVQDKEVLLYFDDFGYLSAIQALREKTASRRRAELNGLIKIVIDDVRGGHISLEDKCRDVPAGFVPLIRVSTGNALKIRDLVREGLVSEDSVVNKRALASRWYFLGSSDHVNASDFIYNLIPHVSLLTRRCIVKRLSYSLLGHVMKAEQFFETIADVYGYNLGIPILVACSSNFIHEKILEHRITLPCHVLEKLYESQPDAAIKYLQLAEPESKANDSREKLVIVRLLDYERFIPKLIKKHPRIFVRLYELMPMWNLKLSRSQKICFLKSLRDLLIDRPKAYLQLLPLKLISKTLSKDQFGEMYKNLFPLNPIDFELNKMIDYLDYYEPHSDKIKVLKETYKTIYGVEIILYKYFCISSNIKLAAMLPDNEKKTLALFFRKRIEDNIGKGNLQSRLKSREDNEDSLKLLCSYQPPKKLLPVLKALKNKVNSSSERLALIKSMILSCKLYQSSDYLLKMLKFYNKNYRDERMMMIGEILKDLQLYYCEEPICSLNNRHWRAIVKIIIHVRDRGELISMYTNTIERILVEALRYYLRCLENDDSYSSSSCSSGSSFSSSTSSLSTVTGYSNFEISNEIARLFLSANFEYSCANWSILQILDDSKLAKRMLELLLNMIPIEYSDSHEIWKRSKRLEYIIFNLMMAINDYNNRFFPKTKKINKNQELRKRNEDDKLNVLSFEWLSKLIIKELQVNDNNEFLELAKRVSFFKMEISNNDVQDIEFGRALTLLKHEPHIVAANWEAYLEQAAKKLWDGNRATKRLARKFVSATKWHDDLGIKFAERSRAQINKPGYSIVLGILLSEKVLEKLMEGFHIESETLEYVPLNWARAIFANMKYENPPPQLEDTISFTINSTLAKYAEPTIMSLVNRIPVKNVFSFARRLAFDSKKRVANKLGILLYKMTGTKKEFFAFLQELDETNLNSKRRIFMTKVILDTFEQYPSREITELVRSTIRKIGMIYGSNEQSNVMDMVKNLKQTLNQYPEDLLEYLDDVGYLTPEGLENAVLGEESIMMAKIFGKYFFKVNSISNTRVILNFIVMEYLLPADGDHFQRALQIIAGFIKSVFKMFGQVHPDKPSFYPSNEILRNFVTDLVYKLEESDNQYSVEKKLRLIDRLIDLLDESLDKQEALVTKVRLSLYKEFMITDSPKDFGRRSAIYAEKFVEQFSSSIIINKVAKVLNDFIDEFNKPTSYKLDVIIGLASVHVPIGWQMAVELFIGIKTMDDGMIEMLKKYVPAEAMLEYLNIHLSRNL